MTGNGGSGEPAGAGGPVPHIPVLAGAVLRALSPRDGGVYIDGTFGAGGHTQQILAAADCRVIAIDRDPTAVARAIPLVERFGGRLTIVEDTFSALGDIADIHAPGGVDGILIDLGVSSMQLDTAERGFSFRQDGPLDMRMGDEGPSAADLVAAASERDLTAIIRTLGEERHARAVARAIVARRGETPILTTRALAEIVSRVVWAKPHEIHPATRTFQALRMFVNAELDELGDALVAAERVLRPGGHLAVIAFHSLEDRIVKRFFASRSRAAAISRHQPVAEGPAPTFRLASTKPVMPDEAEIAENARARSSRLRVGERTDAPPGGLPVEALPDLPSLAEALRGR